MQWSPHPTARPNHRELPQETHEGVAMLDAHRHRGIWWVSVDVLRDASILAC
jgi:hypothetical protein